MFSPPIIPILALLVSLPLLFFITPTILLLKDMEFSSSSPDELDDLFLFHKAIAASSSSSHSSISHLGLTPNQKPKIAFLFLTNSDLSFAPLWEKFFYGHDHLYNIYIHADPQSPITLPGGVFQNRLIPAKTTSRGSPSLISAARRLLANAIIDDPLNLYFALVSQHCIPIHSFRFVYTTLFGNDMTTFASFSTQSKRPSFIEILSDDPNLPERYDARGENVMTPEVPFQHFRVGSQFYILTKQHSLVVIKDKKLWRKFRLPCLNEYSCYPEEHYFPTLLSMEDPEGCSHYTLTRVNWTASTDGHPYTYKRAEISARLVRSLRKSNSSYEYLFARKFSPDCLRPLMKLAAPVIFRD